MTGSTGTITDRGQESTSFGASQAGEDGNVKVGGTSVCGLQRPRTAPEHEELAAASWRAQPLAAGVASGQPVMPEDQQPPRADKSPRLPGPPHLQTKTKSFVKTDDGFTRTMVRAAYSAAAMHAASAGGC